ncbi:hypothetical protein F5Y03DRAFT_340431 [Xylaria venustula]|nr:hypothetical protein F5Y03DRAFT_340431 [Xylaria venustula]
MPLALLLGLCIRFLPYSRIHVYLPLHHCHPRWPLCGRLGGLRGECRTGSVTSISPQELNPPLPVFFSSNSFQVLGASLLVRASVTLLDFLISKVITNPNGQTVVGPSSGPGSLSPRRRTKTLEEIDQGIKDNSGERGRVGPLG